jgi:hypothetical protein
MVSVTKVCYPGYLCSGSFFFSLGLFSLGLSPYSLSSSVCFSLPLSLSLSLCIISIYPPACPLCFFLFRFVLSPVSVSCPLFTRYWLPKIVKTTVNAGSRLCVFIRWCFSSVAPVLEMKERRQ